MTNQNAKLITIYTESVLESRLVDDIEQHGAMGYTISNASSGSRTGSWEANSNIHVEIICDADFAQHFTRHLQKTYYDNYGMVAFTSDIEVLRPQKFCAT